MARIAQGLGGIEGGPARCSLGGITAAVVEDARPWRCSAGSPHHQRYSRIRQSVIGSIVSLLGNPGCAVTLRNKARWSQQRVKWLELRQSTRTGGT
jgi:hypothetical protein